MIPKYFLAFSVSFAALNVLDVITTHIGLSFGAQEMNSNAVIMWNTVGYFYSILIKILLVLALFGTVLLTNYVSNKIRNEKHRRFVNHFVNITSTSIMVIMTIIFAFVVVNNVLVIVSLI